MNLYKETLESYILHHRNNNSPANDRVQQLTLLTSILEENFKFDQIISLETGASQTWIDGMVGYYFASLSNKTGGNFYSVDLDEITDNVIEAYKNIDPNLEINHHTQDSIEFLKNVPEIPNLVHLDSWNFDLMNPLPCALHGWREFEAIEAKMPVGSIIVIDDNWFQGTILQWVYRQDNVITNYTSIHINYPLLGKGTHIYQWVLPGDKNWKLLSTPIVGVNNKIIIQKTE